MINEEILNLFLEIKDLIKNEQNQEFIYKKHMLLNKKIRFMLNDNFELRLLYKNLANAIVNEDFENAEKIKKFI